MAMSKVIQHTKRIANNPKRHHVVPESYLKRFTDLSGFLYVYDRTSGRWGRQRPVEVMHLRYYYRQEWAPAGVDPNILEKCLGEWIENSATITIDRLILNSLEANEDFSTFLLYLEFQRIRVPRQVNMAKTLMRDLILRLAPAGISADIRARKFQLTMKKSAQFEYLRMMVGQLHPWFARMEWEVIEAEIGSAFITTDSPLSFYNVACPPPAEAGIALAGTRVYLPLSSSHLLALRHPESRSNPKPQPLEVLPDPQTVDRLLPITRGTVWSRKTVALHNRMMFQLADRLVVGNNREALEECIL